ncbi:SpoIIE family protein phosphatase [Actinoplanes missouriensis]
MRLAFERGGEMGARMSALDWSGSPAGDPATWPEELVGAVVTMLASRAQMMICWGPRYATLYNDAYLMTLGDKHPGSLGRPAAEVWPESWDERRRLLDRVIASDRAFYAPDHPFLSERYGFPEMTYFDVSYDPIRDGRGEPCGVLCVVTDTTRRVRRERRSRTLAALGRRLTAAPDRRTLAAEAVATLTGDEDDVPFAALRLDEPDPHPAIRAVIESGLPGRVPLAEVTDPPPSAAGDALVLPVAGGALVLGRSRFLALDDEYRDFFDAAAAQIAGALRDRSGRAPLADDTAVLREHVSRLRGLVDVAAALNAVPTTAEVLDVAARHVLAMTSAGRVVVTAPDARAEQDGGAAPAAEPDVVLPLPDAAGPPLGELRVWDGAGGPAEPAVLLQLARLIGLRLANARLYETEHRIASTLQHSLLPPSLPRVPGAIVASRYVPGSSEARVGGDWYDVIAAPDGELFLVIGDVVGKGVQAAAGMGQLRNALRAYVLEGFDCGAALTRLNRLVDTLGRRQFATVICVAFDPRTRRLRFSSAGHPSPIVVAGGEAGDFLYAAAMGPPIGALGSVTYPTREHQLPPGSRLLLYTDGLVEDRHQGIDSGLAELTVDAAQPTEHVEDLLDLLLGKASRHDRRDDIALIALEATEHREFVLRLPAEPDRLTVLRRRLEDFLAAHAVPDDDAFDLVVAVSEAAANAIEHPLDPAEPVIVVEASLTGDAVLVTIRDTGRWRPATDPGFRGRGLALIGALTELSVHRSPEGTAVTLRRPLRPA